MGNADENYTPPICFILKNPRLINNARPHQRSGLRASNWACQHPASPGAIGAGWCIRGLGNSLFSWTRHAPQRARSSKLQPNR